MDIWKINKMIGKSKTTNGNLSILNIGEFDLYNEIDDRIYFKSIINKLFSVGDEVYFFFRREEGLTENLELDVLRKRKDEESQFVS